MSPALKPISDQVIVITGASSGIGLETARQAAEQRAKVVLAARSKRKLDQVVSEIREVGGNAIAVECDVTDRNQLQRVANEAVAKYGRIDTWVNNAGLGMYGRLDESSEADSRRLFDINYWGVVNGSLVALPFLKKNGGALINIGSEVSDAFMPLMGVYTATKHAVKGFTDVLRIEVEELDQAPVAVTLIQPTAVDTAFPKHARNFMDKEPKLPEPLIEPKQVAQAILKAAVSKTRDRPVGSNSWMNTAVAKVLPGVADSMSAKKVTQLMQDESPRHPHGALNRPSEEIGSDASLAKRATASK